MAGAIPGAAAPSHAPYLDVLLEAKGERDRPRIGAAAACPLAPGQACPLAPGQVLQVPAGHLPVAALIDGTRRLVLVRNRDGNVLLFGELSGRLLRTLHTDDPAPLYGLGGLGFAPEVFSYSSATHPSLALDAASGLAYVPNFHRGSVSLIDLKRGQVRAAVATGRQPVTVVLDPRHRHVFVANRSSGTVSMLDATTGRVLHTTRVGGALASMALDASRNHLVVANVTLPLVRVLDTRTGALVHTLGLAPNTVLVDSARRLVLTTNTAQPGFQLSYDSSPGFAPTGAATDTIRLLDATTLAPRRTIVLPPANSDPRMLTAHDIALDRSLGRIVVATGLVLLYRPDGVLVATVHPGFNDFVVAVNPHTHHAIVASWDDLSMHGAITGPGAINIVDERTGRVLRRIPEPRGYGTPMSPVVDAQRDIVAVVSPIKNTVTYREPPAGVGSLTLVCDR
jgi:YVTN family beta-propeller protein